MDSNRRCSPDCCWDCSTWRRARCCGAQHHGHEIAPLVSPEALEAYLHAHIPLARAMQAVVLESSGEVVVMRAPLAPNLNHQASVFGGSASALAMLASWGLLCSRLTDQGLSPDVVRVVIQRNTMTFARPM